MRTHAFAAPMLPAGTWSAHAQPSAADRALIARLLDSAAKRFRFARERDPAMRRRLSISPPSTSSGMNIREPWTRSGLR